MSDLNSGASWPLLDGFTEHGGVVEALLTFKDQRHELVLGPDDYQPLVVGPGKVPRSSTMVIDVASATGNTVHSVGLLAAPKRLQAFIEALRRVKSSGGTGVLAVSAVPEKGLEGVRDALFSEARERGARVWTMRLERERCVVPIELVFGRAFDGAAWAGAVNARHPDRSAVFKPDVRAT